MLCWVGGQVGSPSARLPSAQVRMTLCPTATIRKILTNPAPLSTRSLHNPGEGRALQSTPTACRFGFKPVSEHIQTPYFVFNHIDSQKSSKKTHIPTWPKKCWVNQRLRPATLSLDEFDEYFPPRRTWVAQIWKVGMRKNGWYGDIVEICWDMLMCHDETRIFRFSTCTTLFTPSIFTLQVTPFHSVSLWRLRLQRFAITEAYDLSTNSKSSTTRDPPIHSRNPVNSNCDWLHLTPSNSVPFRTLPYHSGPHFTSLLKPEAVTGTAERWVPSGSNKRGKDMRRKGVALPVAPGETNWFHRDLGTFMAQRNAATCTTLLGAIAETFFLCFTPLFLLVTLRWVWQKLHVTLFVSCQTNILMYIIYYILYIIYDIWYMIWYDMIWCIRIKTFTKHDKHLRSGCSRGLPRWVRRHEGQRLKKNSLKRWRGSSARSPESIWSDKGNRFKTAGTS